MTAVGNGLETDYSRAATWLFFGDKYLYRLSYNMGSDGTTVAFYLDKDGKLRQRSGEYSIKNFTAYGTYGNKIITTATAAGNTADAHGNQAYDINFTLLDVESGAGGTGGGAYTAGTLDGTQYPDECYVAIFDDDTFTNPTIVKTDKMSWAAGRMRSAYYQTVWAADNGDIYVFSPSYAKLQSDPRQRTTHPSSVMRIKKGATEFDNTYAPFDIEAAANSAIRAGSKARPGGDGDASGVADNSKAVYRCWHITDDYFLLQMYANGINAQGTGATRMAVFKGEERTFKYVTGLPDESLISSFPVKNIYCEKGVCYIAVVTADGNQPKVYKIDPATATATQGLSAGVDELGAIGKLIAR